MNEFSIYDKYIERGFVVYDIGAHIGKMSRHFCGLGAKEVHAFEPSSKNISDMKRNLQDKTNVVIHGVALNAVTYDCQTRFKDCRDAFGDPRDQEQEIRYVNLNAYVDDHNLPKPDFVKMDIEGMEAIVLTTCQFLFNGVRPVFYVELHAKDRALPNQTYENNPHWLWPDQGGFDFNDLKKYKYRIIKEDRLLSVEEDYNPPVGYTQGILLIPEEKYEK